MSDNNLFEKYGNLYDSGKVIFQENEDGDEMYIIQEGSVRISKNINGKDHILAVLGKGDFFGEMAIVNRVKRTATATAVGTVKLLSFNREGFIGMIEKNAKIALNIIDKLCRRLQKTNMQIQHLVKRDERGLVALNLYYAFTESGFDAKINSIRLIRDMSLNLELPQEVIIKYLKELREKQIIDLVEDSNIVLFDSGRLADMAESTKTLPR